MVNACQVNAHPKLIVNQCAFSSFSNQNYTSNVPASDTPIQSVPLETDYGAFALTAMTPVQSETTDEIVLPPRKKKKVYTL